MKRIASVILGLLASSFLFADIQIPFFGGNSGGLDFGTTFAADLNDGSTGLATTMGCDLWFEFTPYTDLGLTPRRDKLSVSLKMSNTAIYAWRGYNFNNSGVSEINDIGSRDQAKSIWFGSLIAELQYGEWWLRAAGIDPQITMNQASIKSVLDNNMQERTGDKNQYFRLPLFHSGGPYSGNGGTVSVIGRDLVHLNAREVEIYGMYSAGYKGLDFQANVKAGSWQNGEDNNKNSWVFGADMAWNPTFNTKLTFTGLYAMNYGTYTASSSSRETLDSDDEENTATVVMSAANDPEADASALVEQPLALGAGIEYSIGIPGFGSLRPYAGVDWVRQTEIDWGEDGDWDLEVGAGFMWLFRGPGASFKRNYSLGGMQLSGDTANRVGLGAGFNMNRDGIVNGILSFNEDPAASPIKNLGGFFQVELMNITGKDYTAPTGTVYSDFLYAFIAQLEYKATDKVMPYIFGWYVPSVNYGAAYTDENGETQYSRYAYNNYNDSPTYEKDSLTLTSKLGVKITPSAHYYLDIWYERTDQKSGDEWSTDAGLVSVKVGIKL
ncbi:hypothetical protein [Treponema sp.]|uniref:hypothetical protein n=1 Tax=Treponema sp. TaxID=166 RepID=UPI0025D71FC1|nr:hypothetical protein [Treponema sp.]MCR5217922.1 hypothetical protein [Treponema sp.]